MCVYVYVVYVHIYNLCVYVHTYIYIYLYIMMKELGLILTGRNGVSALLLECTAAGPLE